MSLCPTCGLGLGVTNDDAGLCAHHRYVYQDDWALNNRAMCDFLHRHLEPARLAPAERDDSFWPPDVA